MVASWWLVVFSAVQPISILRTHCSHFCKSYYVSLPYSIRIQHCKFSTNIASVIFLFVFVNNYQNIFGMYKYRGTFSTV